MAEGSRWRPLRRWGGRVYMSKSALGRRFRASAGAPGDAAARGRIGRSARGMVGSARSGDQVSDGVLLECGGIGQRLARSLLLMLWFKGGGAQQMARGAE